MITNRIYLPEIISVFISHGFAPITIRYKSKPPVNKDEQCLKYLKAISERISISILSTGRSRRSAGPKISR